MSILSNPRERLTHAQSELDAATRDESRVSRLAVQAAGHHSRDPHPAQNAGRRAKLAAQIELAQAQSEFDASDPALANLRGTLRKALERARADLAATADPPLPKLDLRNVEAHAEALERHTQTLSANTTRRKAICGALMPTLRAAGDALKTLRTQRKAKGEPIAWLFASRDARDFKALVALGGYMYGSPLEELARVAVRGNLTAEAVAEALASIGTVPADVESVRRELRELDDLAERHDLAIAAARAGKHSFKFKGCEVSVGDVAARRAAGVR